jgi:sulfur carrier protein ThiS
MERCTHCNDAFDGEDELIDHLAAEHSDELTSLEQRKVDTVHTSTTDSIASYLPSGGMMILLVIIVFAGALVAFVSFGLGSGSTVQEGQQPTHIGGAHYHGTMEMVVNGDRVDFSQHQYQLQADAFHFEGGDGRQWHAHARGVTVFWAMQSLGINVTQNAVTYNGETYRDSDPNTNVVVEANGDPIDPKGYVFQQGDTIRIIVSQDN